MDVTQQILGNLRKCGHYLHHNFGRGNTPETAELLSALTEEEKGQLLALLEKITKDLKLNPAKPEK